MSAFRVRGDHLCLRPQSPRRIWVCRHDTDSAGLICGSREEVELPAARTRTVRCRGHAATRTSGQCSCVASGPASEVVGIGAWNHDSRRTRDTSCKSTPRPTDRASRWTSQASLPPNSASTSGKDSRTSTTTPQTRSCGQRLASRHPPTSGHRTRDGGRQQDPVDRPCIGRHGPRSRRKRDERTAPRIGVESAMPTYDALIVEHLVVHADRVSTFRAVRALDFLARGWASMSSRRRDRAPDPARHLPSRWPPRCRGRSSRATRSRMRCCPGRRGTSAARVLHQPQTHGVRTAFGPAGRTAASLPRRTVRSVSSSPIPAPRRAVPVEHSARQACEPPTGPL